MLNRILSITLIFFSFFLALGTADPFFDNGSLINSVDIFFSLFTFGYLILKPDRYILRLLSFDSFVLFTIVILFTLGQVLNGYSNLIVPLVNFKFILCILFYLALSSFATTNQTYIHYSLLAYSISSILFTITVLFINTDLYQIYKGQLIVLEENPNSTSSRLVLAVSYLLYTASINPLKIKKPYIFITMLCIPIIIYLIVLSGSRGSLLSMLIGIYLIFIFKEYKVIYKIILTSLLVLGSMILFKVLLTSESLSSRWIKALEGDTAGRTDIWNTVIQISLKSPLGVGETGYIEKMSNAYGYYIDTHNLFLYVLVCGGFVSLLLFTLLWLRLLLRSLRSYRYSKDILPILLFIIIFFIVSKTGGVITYLLYWYVFAIISSYQREPKYERKYLNSSVEGI